MFVLHRVRWTGNVTTEPGQFKFSVAWRGVGNERSNFVASKLAEGYAHAGVRMRVVIQGV